MQTVISLKDIRVTLGQNFSLSVERLVLQPHRIYALTGPNGAGKSTLLHIAAGLEAPDAGSVHVLGQALTAMDDSGRARLRRRDIALVFQQLNLIPSLTVGANISFQAALAGTVDTARVTALAEALGLSDQLSKYPEALSGGQQQRVFLARSIVQDAELILLDEPFGGIDAKSEVVIVDILRRQKQHGKSIVAVHHDLSTVKDYFDDVILLNKTVTAFGPINDVFTKSNIEKTYGVSNLDFLTGRS